MAHIDTSKIAGFDGMTAEQKLEALMAFDIPDPNEVDKSKWVDKKLFDSKTSELAEANRKLKGKMTEEEQAAAARAEKEAADKAAMDELRQKLDEAVGQLAISKYKSSYLALGYDEKMAQETAEALHAGKMDVVFENGKKHKDAIEQKVKAELMKSDMKPGGGSGDDAKGDAAVAKAKELAKAKTGSNDALKNALDYYSM